MTRHKAKRPFDWSRVRLARYLMIERVASLSLVRQIRNAPEAQARHRSYILREANPKSCPPEETRANQA